MTSEGTAHGPSVAAHAGVGDVSSPGVRRVMACLDGSPFAETCLPYAAFMARVLGAELTLLRVMACASGGVDVVGWEVARREAQQYLASMHAGLEARGVPSARIHDELAQGQPADRVLALERENEVTLTVLSRRGDGSAPPGNIGATADRVLANACGSVLIVPSEGGAADVPPQRILVPLDGSTRAESVLPLVVETAAASRAEIVLVHVVTEPRVSEILRSAEDLSLATRLTTRLEASAHAYLDSLRQGPLRDAPRVKLQVLRRADTREALLDLARDEKVDLIVLSAHGTTCNTARPFGSVTTDALAHAMLPLLVVQDLSRNRPSWDAGPATGEPSARRSSIPSYRHEQ